MKLRLIDARAVESLIEMAEVVETVAEAFAAYGRGEARMPPKIYLNVPDGDFRAMPAALGELAGVKWVNVHPGNASRGLPSVMATMLLNDATTGRPLAVLDATRITKLRTGAAAGVATRALARRDARTVAMIGCGGQAAMQIRALMCVMEIEELYLVDLNDENARARAAEFAELRTTVAGIEQACRTADVIVTVTPAREPVVKGAWIRPGTHINAMGADAPGKRECDTELIQTARIYVDDPEQAAHSGEINVPLASGELTRRELAGTLPDLLSGSCAGRGNDEEITLFDSTGLAVQDLAVARLVYRRAEERGVGQEVEFDFDA